MKLSNHCMKIFLKCVIQKDRSLEIIVIRYICGSFYVYNLILLNLTLVLLDE